MRSLLIKKKFKYFKKNLHKIIFSIKTQIKSKNMMFHLIKNTQSLICFI